MTIQKYAEIDFELIADSDFEQFFNWEDESGNAVDITGYTFTMEISATEGVAPILSQAGTITDAAQGEFNIKIESTVLTTLTADTYYFYRILDDDGAGGEFYQVAGRIRQVTK